MFVHATQISRSNFINPSCVVLRLPRSFKEYTGCEIPISLATSAFVKLKLSRIRVNSVFPSSSLANTFSQSFIAVTVFFNLISPFVFCLIYVCLFILLFIVHLFYPIVNKYFLRTFHLSILPLKTEKVYYHRTQQLNVQLPSSNLRKTTFFPLLDTLLPLPHLFYSLSFDIYPYQVVCHHSPQSCKQIQTLTPSHYE